MEQKSPIRNNPSEPFNELPALPPEGVELETPAILRHLAKAARYIGELNGLCESMPDPQLLISSIVLQESKDSSAIENIVTTNDELYKAAAGEISGHPAAKEVLSYREALYSGLDRMTAQKGLLLTNTLVEIVQKITKNDAGIRNKPGTALTNDIASDIVYTQPYCKE